MKTVSALIINSQLIRTTLAYQFVSKTDMAIQGVIIMMKVVSRRDYSEMKLFLTLIRVNI
ncbi:hypothetical protein FC98_GL002369 [Lentilactobacillus kisonensis DSM 19906 = JCM 15041]|uniref:Uncharacterized protein n=2 Tax=Lentilactobacillus kisonensis TaxID=481722 RepID=H1LKQ4_9LACO|nr:hypothetical protein HMPREF9104_03208 [Lentilactobacillus kisonensis F0435]KRL22483.1 hypothetical protein FC98_GL002369 [Lentilactobacillus kisonensis DSM 19906 = JCM 15041]